ncbi:MAG: hypothetical protein AAB691_04870 [Patescibacteria group bacterium]
MKYQFRKTIVLALGGSILYPENIDTRFIQKFARTIQQFVREENKRFVTVTGGGRLSRLYQKAASEIVPITDEDKDWLGIHATRLNAHLMRTVFKDIADPVVFDTRHKRKKIQYPVTFASGWRPGWSTDYIAVALAVDYGASEVIIAGKPSHVYPHTKRESRQEKNNSRSGVGVYDPSNPSLDYAEPFTTLSWKEYRKLIPQKWTPGFQSPVDPVGARLAQKEGIKAIVVDGRDLKNFSALIKGKEFVGTIIT